MYGHLFLEAEERSLSNKNVYILQVPFLRRQMLGSGLTTSCHIMNEEESK